MIRPIKLFLFGLFFCSFSVFSQSLLVKYRFIKENSPIADYELNIEKDYSLFRESEYCLKDSILKSELMILKDKSNSIKVLDKAGDTPLLTNKLNQIEWKIKKEKKIIGGYKAQLAEVIYKGEKWTAWFTSDLPFQDGPFIFNNLPGLILTIENSKYKFDLLSISKTKSNCSTTIDTKAKEISYDKYESLFNNVSSKNDALLNSIGSLNLGLETKVNSIGEKEKKINILREIL